jgi:16S rRNA processing protein RimM
MSAHGEWVSLARILRPQGRKGEVFAHILTDFPEKFASRRRLWLIQAGDNSAQTPGAPRLRSNPSSPIREVELINHWLHKGGVVLHFAGVDSISTAESLKGLIVAIPRAERVPLAEDAAYIDDLIGSTLIDNSGASPVVVGTISDVDRTAGPAPLLIVRGAMGEILIPFAKLYLRKIDIAAKRVEMALPEGLVSLNAE